MSISGGLVGSYSQIGKTFILEDENGNEITGVVVDKQTIFTATADDIKIGKIAATDDGITEGLDTKTYRVTFSSHLILPGADFSIPLGEYDKYNYTKFQCMIAKFNTSFSDSVEASKVAINDNVYQVNSVNIISQITRNVDTKSIDLNITNDTEDYYVIHYSTYKEE